METIHKMNGMVICFTLLLGGCGAVTDTRDLVQKGNQTQSDILDGVERTAELTSKMKEILGKTENVIHLQMLSVAWQGMISPDNVGSLNPPTRMMPFAEAFATEATQDELIRVVHLLLTDAMMSTASQEFRMVSLVALSSIAGFTSLEKTKAILRSQIEMNGKYQSTAHVFGVVRHDFIRDYLFNPIIETSKFLNVATLYEAVSQFNNLKHLAALPYVNTLELKIPSLSVVTKLEPALLKSLGRKAKRRFIEKMDLLDLQTSEVKDLLRVFDS